MTPARRAEIENVLTWHAVPLYAKDAIRELLAEMDQLEEALAVERDRDRLR